MVGWAPRRAVAGGWQWGGGETGGGRKMGLPATPPRRTPASPPRAGSCLCPRVPPNEVSSSAEPPRCFQDRSRPGLGRRNRRPHPPISPRQYYRGVELHRTNAKTGQNRGGGAENIIIDSWKNGGDGFKPCASAPFERGRLGVAAGGGPRALGRSLWWKVCKSH